MERCTGEGGGKQKVGGAGIPSLDSSTTIQQWPSLLTNKASISYTQETPQGAKDMGQRSLLTG